MNKVVKILIRIYQIFLSPLLGKNCRFDPTCSRYAMECFEKFSFFKALWYSIKRLLSCHPWGKFGEDPVPLGKKNYHP